MLLADLGEARGCSTNTSATDSFIELKKNKNFLTARSLNCSILAKFCPMLVQTPYSLGVVIPKTYLNQELGSKFFPK